MAKVPYEVLARWRNGWELIKHPTTDQHYIRRMFQGMHKVNATKSGFATWRITDPKTNEVPHPNNWKAFSAYARQRAAEVNALLRSFR